MAAGPERMPRCVESQTIPLMMMLKSCGTWTWPLWTRSCRLAARATTSRNPQRRTRLPRQHLTLTCQLMAKVSTTAQAKAVGFLTKFSPALIGSWSRIRVSETHANATVP
eukprot:6176207-Pleurochrysis_carterae.AAC.1